MVVAHLYAQAIPPREMDPSMVARACWKKVDTTIHKPPERTTNDDNLTMSVHEVLAGATYRYTQLSTGLIGPGPQDFRLPFAVV